LTKVYDLNKVFIQEPVVVKGALNFSLKTIAKALHNNGLIRSNWDSDNKCSNGLNAMIMANDLYDERNIMNNIKGGANQQRGIEQLITIKSDVTIEFNRYESVFYYETLEMYTSEFVNLITYKNTVADAELNDFFIVKDSDKSCTRESTKICDTLMQIKDKALNINPSPTTTTINTSGIGSYILESIILNKIYKHSLINLINDPTNQTSTLIIVPYSKNKLTPYLKESKIKTFYTNLFSNDTTRDNLIFINVFPQNSDDDVDTYTNQITAEINKIKQEIIKRSKEAGKAISKIMYLVNADNTMFTDFFQVQLKKKYADVLNSLIDKFYKTDVIERQRINRYNTKIENLSKINKAYIIKELGLKDLPSLKEKIKQIINKEDFKNKIALLLTILDTLYKIRLDASEKKKLSSADNSSLFNIFKVSYISVFGLEGDILFNLLLIKTKIL
jgi:hypothetical protein